MTTIITPHAAVFSNMPALLELVIYTILKLTYNYSESVFYSVRR